MRNNENFYKRLEEDIHCCKPDECNCKESPQTCGEKAKREFEKYLEAEACKPEPEVTFNLCDYDPDQVYFMQYRSPRSLINHSFYRIFDDSFDNTFE